MPPCKGNFFFNPEPVKYDLNDEEFVHEFRKCMFALKIKSGVYHFENRENGDYIKYHVIDGKYAGSCGVLNGSPIKISIGKKN